MQSTFTLTRDDFRRFQKLVNQRFKRRIGAFSSVFVLQVACWAFVGLAGSSLYHLMKQHPEISGSLTVLSVFLSLALLAMLIGSPIQQAVLRKHMLLPGGAFLSPQTIRVLENTLIMEAERGRSELAWSGFVGVEQDDHNYYLLTDAIQAVIVPKAAVLPFRTYFENRLLLIKNAV